MRIRRNRFTLAELLAALALAAIVIPVATAAVQHANRAAEMARRSEIAAQLGSEKLRELIVSGDWETGEESGDYGENWPGYRWALSVSDWDEDDDYGTTMTLVGLQTEFVMQGAVESVSIWTLVVTASE